MVSGVRNSRQTFGREMHRATASFSAEFAENILHVLVHGARRGSDFSGNLRIALSDHEPVQHLALSRRQPQGARSMCIRRFWSLSLSLPGRKERSLQVNTKPIGEELFVQVQSLRIGDYKVQLGSTNRQCDMGWLVAFAGMLDYSI